MSAAVDAPRGLRFDWEESYIDAALQLIASLPGPTAQLRRLVGEPDDERLDLFRRALRWIWDWVSSEGAAEFVDNKVNRAACRAVAMGLDTLRLDALDKLDPALTWTPSGVFRLLYSGLPEYKRALQPFFAVGGEGEVAIISVRILNLPPGGEGAAPVERVNLREIVEQAVQRGDGSFPHGDAVVHVQTSFREGAPAPRCFLVAVDEERGGRGLRPPPAGVAVLDIERDGSGRPLRPSPLALLGHAYDLAAFVLRQVDSKQRATYALIPTPQNGCLPIKQGQNHRTPAQPGLVSYGRVLGTEVNERLGWPRATAVFNYPHGPEDGIMERCRGVLFAFAMRTEGGGRATDTTLPPLDSVPTGVAPPSAPPPRRALAGHPRQPRPPGVRVILDTLSKVGRTRGWHSMRVVVREGEAYSVALEGEGTGVEPLSHDAAVEYRGLFIVTLLAPGTSRSSTWLGRPECIDDMQAKMEDVRQIAKEYIETCKRKSQTLRRWMRKAQDSP